MCDPLDFWFGNTEILESLSQYLRPWDLGKMSLVSRRWREALNVDHIWYRMCRRMDLGFIQLFGKVEDNMEEDSRTEMPMFCSSFHWRVKPMIKMDWWLCVIGGNISPCVKESGGDGGVEDRR